MTLSCPCCDSTAIHLEDDNGAMYPRTRVELYECDRCGHEFTKVVTT